MASGYNPQQTQQLVHDDDRVDTSAPQTGTPSSIRLANIPERDFENATNLLRMSVSPELDDNKMRYALRVVWLCVHDALKQDPELKKVWQIRTNFMPM